MLNSLLKIAGGDYVQRGWIKSYKKKLDWEWFTEPLTAHLFDYLLHAVNYEDKHTVESNNGRPACNELR